MNKTKQEKVIEALVEQTRSLLEDHWSEAERVFAGVEQIKIGIQLLVDSEGAETTCKVTISFGSRIKDSNESTVHDQPELPLPEVRSKRRKE